jgi:hypothetical protein
MNKTIENIIRTKLKELIVQCTEGQQLLFKRMYSHDNLELPIEEVVDNMYDVQLDWAFSQVENTLKKMDERRRIPIKEPDPTLPKFVKLGNTSLRLVGLVYYRDAGDWGVQYRYIDGVLVSWAWGRGKPQLHKVPLVEITEEEWREGNGQYAPETLEDE